MLQKLLAGTTLEGVTVKAKTNHEQVLDENMLPGLFVVATRKHLMWRPILLRRRP